MDAATVSPAALAKQRRTVAERLLRRETEVAETLRLIDEDKDALRALSGQAGEGFAIEVKGLGTVTVTARRKKELTGTSPELVVAAYLGLSEARQKKLVEDGIVAIVKVYKAGAKPSVKVTL
jgi:hypothetical protein